MRVIEAPAEYEGTERSLFLGGGITRLDQLTQAHLYRVEPSSNPVHEMSAFPYMPGGQLL